MKELTQCDIENLKSMSWEYRDTRYPFIANSYDDATFYELTGFDLRPLKNVTDSQEGKVYSEIAYTRPGVRDERCYCLHWYVSVDGGIICDGTIAQYSFDVLKLYEKLDRGDTVEEYFNDSLAEIVNKIKNTYPEVYNAIQNEGEKNTDLHDVLENAINELGEDGVIGYLEDNFERIPDTIRKNYSENLEVDDIGECLKDDIGRDWCERNADDAYDIAIENMDSYECKDKIIDYLQNNL